MLSNKSLCKKHAVIFFTLIIILAFGRGAVQQYGVLISSYILVLTFFIFNKSFPKIKRVYFSYWDFFPAIFLLVWLYGVLLGLALGNKLSYIVANFAGMVGYFFYYLLLISKIRKESLYVIVIYISIFILFQNIILSILLYVFNVFIYYGENLLIAVFFGYFKGGSSTGQIRMLAASQMMVFPLFVLALSYSLIPSLKYAEKLKLLKSHHLLFVFLATYVVIFLPASKGYVLAGMILLLYIFIFSSASSGKVNVKKTIILFTLLTLVLVILLSTGYINIISSMFAKDDESNIARYAQLYSLLEDIDVWGKGLGATVKNASRNPEKPYGFELTYINMIHKFGVMSLLLFFSYAYTMIKIFKEYKANVIEKKYILTSLGLMCFIFPSIGNPFLFSVQCVLMHVISLYFLRRDNKFSRKNYYEK
ncbi:hypothetical protein ESZ36_01445 [Colwellia demingiae]|uniref:O-antigen ligase family protein n=1 Tax=Colwellia demingiae TaxID=89401 RepID=A0A5C6QTB2_9GAMM|nr:hypothetical protein [Colwellia demingiae]TWX71923.1 hypothetical protein ESZ36_01445 [Colwellia demingiae]